MEVVKKQKPKIIIQDLNVIYNQNKTNEMRALELD